MASTILALDIGEKRIGIARANIIAKIAEPLATLQNDAMFRDSLLALIKEHDAEQIVVGLPRGLEGQDTKQTSYVRDFVDDLNLLIDVIFQDEALTSLKAKEQLESSDKIHPKADIDSLAAMNILEDFLIENDGLL